MTSGTTFVIFVTIFVTSVQGFHPICDNVTTSAIVTNDFCTDMIQLHYNTDVPELKTEQTTS